MNLNLPIEWNITIRITGRYVIYRTTDSNIGLKRKDIAHKHNPVNKSFVEPPFPRASYMETWGGDTEPLPSHLQRLRYNDQIFIRKEGCNDPKI